MTATSVTVPIQMADRKLGSGTARAWLGAAARPVLPRYLLIAIVVSLLQ
jgi:hypothetical protein